MENDPILAIRWLLGGLRCRLVLQVAKAGEETDKTQPQGKTRTTQTKNKTEHDRTRYRICFLFGHDKTRQGKTTQGKARTRPGTKARTRLGQDSTRQQHVSNTSATRQHKTAQDSTRHGGTKGKNTNARTINRTNPDRKDDHRAELVSVGPPCHRTLPRLSPTLCEAGTVDRVDTFIACTHEGRQR